MASRSFYFFASFFLVLSYVIFPCNGSLIIHNSTTGNDPSYQAVPIAWDANPLVFNDTTGFLVLHNRTESWLAAYNAKFPGSPNPPIILVTHYFHYERPYIEERLILWARTVKPVGLVVLGEYVEGSAQELGSFDQIRMGINTRESTFPIVQAAWSGWYDLKELLMNDTIINATITDNDVNAWRALRSSWWFPTWISVAILWSLINAGFAIRSLTNYKCERSLSVVVLWAEVLSNLMRIPFLMDPFGVWFIPIPLIHVFLSMYWPVHTIGSILVIFFWHELVTSTKIDVNTGFLTSGKYPALVIIVIMVVVEFSTSAARAAGLYGFLVNLNAAVYVIILIGLSVIYFYVYALVYRFFKHSPSLRSRDAVLQRVSFRFLLTAFSFVALLIFGALTITSIFASALGQSIVHAGMVIIFNIGSSCTISAFVDKPGSKTDSSTLSGVSRQGPANQQPLSWKGRSTVSRTGGESDQAEDNEEESEEEESSESDTGEDGSNAV